MSKQLNSYFHEAVGFVESVLGIDMTLCEKAALRKMTEYVMGIKKTDNPFSDANIDKTAGAMFLHEYYDIPCFTQEERSRISRAREEGFQNTGYDAVAEYFRRMQEAYHKP
jgi:hypothetical protein